ncbi:molybdate ABC transporter substrate-binding protein [Microbacterium stercoris]|nr:molybdate ABC transporter substrate-binding protein [Microbacterium stercoris]
MSAALLLAALSFAGCATGPAAPADPVSSTSSGTAGALSGELTVFAAASLKNAFEQISTEFEADHPGVDVRPLVTDGSQVLATQLAEGAAVDVFASADEANMDRVRDLVAEPRPFATNTMIIAVPTGNPAGIAGLEDLADPGRIVVLCAVEVPCGAASAALFENAGLTPAPDSLEQNVSAVLTKVAAGEADAGLVYRTDAAAGEVDIVEAEGAADVVSRYPIAAVRGAANSEAAAALVDFVTGVEGQRILKSFGFGAP